MSDRSARKLLPVPKLGDDRGSVMPIFAVGLLVILSLAGATIALSFDSRAATNLQISADESALSGATAFLNAASPRADDRLKAAKIAAEASARANSTYAIAKLDVGAVTEDAYGQKTVIEVALKFTPVNPAAQIAGRTASIDIERTAAASATWGFPLCILGLNPNAAGLATSGAASLSAENCIVWSNTTGSRSMEFTGGTASTKYFCASGNAYVSSASVTPRPNENCAPIPDPLASWTAPLPGKIDMNPFPAGSKNKSPNPAALAAQLSHLLDQPVLKTLTNSLIKSVATGAPLSDAETQSLLSTINSIALGVGGRNSALMIDKKGVFTKGAAKGLHVLEVAQILGLVDNLPSSVFKGDIYSISPTSTLSPGTYAGLDISEGHVRMKPGIYHIVGAPLVVRRRATLSGDGVTIILHGDRATFSVLDQARATLTAPSDGETAGFTIAENRRAKLSGKNVERSRLTGSGSVELIGTIYLPRQKFSITGEGSADQASPLLQLVASNIEMTHQGALKIRFDPSRTDVPMTILPAREARLIH
jgi:hypothetical protein